MACDKDCECGGPGTIPRPNKPDVVESGIQTIIFLLALIAGELALIAGMIVAIK